MRLRSLAIRSLWVSATAAVAAGCGFDWGQIQRYGSCGDCELVIKVEGIFDPMAVPIVQHLERKNDPTSKEAGYPSLLKNFDFANNLDGWNADSNVLQTLQLQSLALTTQTGATTSQPFVAGSSQCLPVDVPTPYQLHANVLLTNGDGKAAVSLEFFAGHLCSGKSLQTLASPSVLESKVWREISMFALTPAEARSVRVRFFLIKGPTAPAFIALFDNALFQHADGVPSF